MKKLLITVALIAAIAPAFGQGRVKMLNDATSKVVLTTDVAHVLPADSALKGMQVGNTVPLSQILRVGIYAGSAQNNLFLYSTSLLTSTILNSQGGYGPMQAQLIAGVNGAGITTPGVAAITGGTAIGASTPWFQLRFWSGAFNSYEQAQAASVSATENFYGGVTPFFQMNPGASTYISMAPANANSTWVSGNIVLTTFQPVPEPASLALLGLGAAAMLIFRRRQ
jgi:hypothetical protein